MFIGLWTSVAGMAAAVLGAFMILAFAVHNVAGGVTIALLMALLVWLVLRAHRRAAPMRAKRDLYWFRIHDREDELAEITGRAVARTGAHHPVSKSSHHGQWLP